MVNDSLAASRFTALGTLCVVVTSAPDVLDDARRIVQSELDSIDRACSRFRTDSELARVNAAQGTETVVSPLLFEALRIAVAAAHATNGLVDPTIGRALRALGYDLTFSIVRARRGWTTRQASVPAPGWTSVRLDPSRRTVRIPDGVELDLGATAKAFAADRSAASAVQRVGGGVLVSLGGDVAVAGDAPAGGWSLLLADDNTAPVDERGPAISVTAGGVATSGTTVRRWSTAEGDMHHILDPRTGRAAVSPWRTASVAAATCVDANTASTAAIVLGESAPSWLAARGLPARLVRVDGATTTVAGWPEDSEWC